HHDADLRGDVGEIADAVEREEAALPEGEAAEEIQRNRRHAEPAREPAEDPQGEKYRTELDEAQCDSLHDCEFLPVPINPGSGFCSRSPALRRYPQSPEDHRR